MAASLKDISKLTGINICSISQVLNNHPKAMSLRPETREKILAAAKELGYYKNEMAASMTRKNNRILALITCPMGSNEYTGIIQSGILNTVAERDYTIIVFRLETLNEEDIIKKLIGWRVAGVIFHISLKNRIEKIIEILNKNSICYGYVNLSNPQGIGVTSDDRAGIENAVKYLIDKGHKKIAFMKTKMINLATSEYASRRLEGYLNGIAKYNPAQQAKVFDIPNLHLVEDKQCLEPVIKEIIDSKIDAVICLSDFVAADLNNVALKMNYRIPDDFSLIGFGNSIIANTLFPPLTTLVQDFEMMSRATVNAIIDTIEGKTGSNITNIMQPVILKERKSVKDRN